MRQAEVAIDQPVVPDRQFVTALARGLKILGCFHPARPSLTVTEIAAELGLPQPTAWRLCQTMLSLGYLTANHAGRLRPALAVLRLGYATLSELPLAELARPYLQDLANTAGGAAGMAIRDGHDMRFVQRCESPSQLVLNLRIGSCVPVATSAMGWAYLAGLPEAEWDAASGSPVAWAAAKPAFRAALGEFMTEGFIINPGVLHPGYTTVAVPVMGNDGRPALTLNCGAAASVLSVDKLRSEVGPRLRVLAALIAASL